MRGFLIDTDRRTITAVETPGGLKSMYAALSRPGHPPVDDINAVDIGRDHCLWVDGVGFLSPDIPVFHIQGYANPLAGRGLILGIDGAGENCDASPDLDVILPLIVTWTDKVSSGRLEPTVERPGHIRIGGPILKAVS